MEPLAVMLVAALQIAPASGGNLLAKDVSSWSVDLDWTELIPGFEVMTEGVYHNVTLLFSTENPWTLRLVELSTFSGTVGSVTLTMDGATMTGITHVLALIKVRGGAIEWAKLGVPMGWPFQLLLA